MGACPCVCVCVYALRVCICVCASACCCDAVVLCCCERAQGLVDASLRDLEALQGLLQRTSYNRSTLPALFILRWESGRGCGCWIHGCVFVSGPTHGVPTVHAFFFFSFSALQKNCASPVDCTAGRNKGGKLSRGAQCAQAGVWWCTVTQRHCNDCPLTKRTVAGLWWLGADEGWWVAWGLQVLCHGKCHATLHASSYPPFHLPTSEPWNFKGTRTWGLGSWILPGNTATSAPASLTPGRCCSE